MSELLIKNSYALEQTHTQVDGQKYLGQGKSKKLARIDAATCALRDFIQFKDQQIKNGVIGIVSGVGSATAGVVGGSGRGILSPNAIGVGVNHHPGSAINNNFDYDFTSDDHIEQNTGILNSNSNCSIANIKDNNDTVNQSDNQTNTLEDENLVQKIQQSLENFKKAKTENIAWVNRLQSKRIYF